MTTQITVSIVGSGGDGAVAAGDILAMACAREGLHVIKTEAYGPQIRGGESSCAVRISTAPIFAQADAIDALIVFNWADFARFHSELTPGPGALVFHEEKDTPPPELTSVRLIPIPFTALAREAGAPSGKNILALGLLADRQHSQRHQPTRNEDMQRLAGQGLIVVVGNYFLCFCADFSGAVL